MDHDGPYWTNKYDYYRKKTDWDKYHKAHGLKGHEFLYMIGVSVVGAILTHYAIKVFSSREEEKHADLEAATKLKCVEGGIKFLKRVLAKNRHTREEGSFFKKLLRKLTISEHGDYYLDWRHPMLTTRLRYLKKLSEQVTARGDIDEDDEVPVSIDEYSAEIRQILSDMGVNSDYEHVKIFGKSGGSNIRREIRHNEDELKHVKLFLNPDWWKGADDGQKRFAIAREVSHITNKRDRLYEWFVLIPVLYAGYLELCLLTHIDKKFGVSVKNNSGIPSKKLGVPLASLSLLTLAMITSIWPRKEERYADIEAATMLGSAEGGIKFLEEEIEKNKQWREKGGIITRFFRRFIVSEDGNVRTDLGYTALTERLESLKELAGKLKVETEEEFTP